MPHHIEVCQQGHRKNGGENFGRVKKKVTEEVKFPLVLQNSSSSSMASTKWPRGKVFRIRTWNWSMSRVSNLQNQLFFKNICHYAANSMYIHARIPFNFTTVFNTKKSNRPHLQSTTRQTWRTFQNTDKITYRYQANNHQGKFRRFPRHHQSTVAKHRDFNAWMTQKIHCDRHLHCGHGHGHLQHNKNNMTWRRTHWAQIKKGLNA